jgi:hypothetical protein
VFHQTIEEKREYSQTLTTFMATIIDDWATLKEERNRLRNAIIKHRSQIADDRCIEDDDELYKAVGDGIRDRRVGNQEEMLANCKRYISQRCTSGGHWITYTELLNRLCEAITALKLAERIIAAGADFENQLQSLVIDFGSMNTVGAVGAVGAVGQVLSCVKNIISRNADIIAEQ